MEKVLTHAGLFEGIGGFSLGAQRAGINTIWFSEMNHYKKAILHQHFTNTKLYGKIENIQNPPYADIITGGFPCTDISTAGKMSGIAGNRSSLWQEMYRILYEVKPKYIIIENSPQLLNAGLEFVLYDLYRIGYNAEWKTLQANWFGHRHRRKRIFIIAYPMRLGSTQRFTSIFKFIPEIFQQKQNAEQTYLPGLLKRFDRHSDTTRFRANTGIFEGLDKNALHAIGDSVNVDIAHYLFECIKIHSK